MSTILQAPLHSWDHFQIVELSPQHCRIEMTMRLEFRYLTTVTAGLPVTRLLTEPGRRHRMRQRLAAIVLRLEA